MSNDNSIPEILQAALAYAKRGWRVIPVYSPNGSGCSCKEINCESPGKHPRNAHGLKEATIDEEQIKRWWQRWPDANVGIATGAASGLVVLDVDPRHGGDKTLEALQEKYGGLPDTVIARTGGGGWHFFFKHPGFYVKCDNRGELLGAGIDIKGAGGYIVAPPSLHASGRRYEWEPFCGPDDAEGIK
jgi:hypothetical protein